MARSLATLQDAFEDCDQDWLTDAVISFHSRWRIKPPEMGRSRFDAVVRRVSTSLRSMELAAATSSAVASPRYFIPHRRFALRGRGLIVTMDYLWLTEATLAELFAAMGRAGLRPGAPVSSEIQRVWGARLLELGDAEWENLAAAPWPLALQGRVVGVAGLTGFDYHCFLASIYWMLAERAAPDAEAAERNGAEAEGSDAPDAGRVEPDVARDGPDSIDLFEFAYDRMLRTCVAELNARACWDVLAALAGDINDFETIEP